MGYILSALLTLCLAVVGCATHGPSKSERFHDAIYDSDVPAVKAALASGAKVNTPFKINGGWTPLQRAAACRNVEIVQLLLEHGAAVDATIPTNQETPLYYAVQDGSPDIAAVLLGAGADPNRKNIRDDWTSLDCLYGYRYVGRLRSLSRREFIRFEHLLVEHGGVETLHRSEMDKEHSREKPPSE